MDHERKKGIIIQARMGSTRLPGKMAKSFFNGKTLLEIVLERMEPASGRVPVIVATSVNQNDDFIEELSENMGFPVFRGSETDVMSRFIEAADMYGVEMIIRICGDNPFLQWSFVKALLEYDLSTETAYVGYRICGEIPAIKSHLGFFPEMVSTTALKTLHDQQPDVLYREHVTNYFYSEANNLFPVEWIDLDYPQELIKNVRLTIDTEEDFLLVDRVYKYFHGNKKQKDSAEEIFKYLERNPSIMNEMKKNIERNEK
jgi:spore coat polysaccharide biosynthesis protein SpsF (cytidylyltransferase family)